MKEKVIQGIISEAKVFTVDNDEIAIDQIAESQIKLICDNEVSCDSMIRVMPDVHAGKVGPIGLSMQFCNERIIPNLIGNDIGCGIESWEIFPKHKLTDSDFIALDRIIRKEIPVYSKKDQKINDQLLDLLHLLTADVDITRVCDDFATLGGGNHFIEIDKSDSGKYLLTIHSGSRILGNFINDYYNKEGQKILKSKCEDVPYEMTYIKDSLFFNYMDDVKIANTFAKNSRASMAEKICKGMNWKFKYFGGSIHNTVEQNTDDFSDYPYMLHKGSCSTISNWPIIIPINMKDGIIIAKGKYNYEWNNSCPHGSGRLVKRTDIKDSVTLSAFKKEMDGIFSTSINKETLDESPFAYRRINDIKDVINDTVEIIEIAKPLFSFKGGK